MGLMRRVERYECRGDVEIARERETGHRRKEHEIAFRELERANPSRSRKHEPSSRRQNAGSLYCGFWMLHCPAPLTIFERTVCGRRREMMAASGSEVSAVADSRLAPDDEECISDKLLDARWAISNEPWPALRRRRPLGSGVGRMNRSRRGTLSRHV